MKRFQGRGIRYIYRPDTWGMNRGGAIQWTGLARRAPGYRRSGKGSPAACWRVAGAGVFGSPGGRQPQQGATPTIEDRGVEDSTPATRPDLHAGKLRQEHREVAVP